MGREIKIMKSINHKKLLVVSRQTGVSIFLLTRREMNYRKTTCEKNCLICKAHDTPQYLGNKRNQCHIIGIGDDQYAEVDAKHFCDYFTKSEFKIKLQEDSKDERTF